MDDYDDYKLTKPTNGFDKGFMNRGNGHFYMEFIECFVAITCNFVLNFVIRCGKLCDTKNFVN